MRPDSTISRRVDNLCQEQRRRWQEGDSVTAEMLLAAHPDLGAEPECVLELLYNEVLLREEQGDTPQLAEYLRRFPDLATRLKPLFEVHGALESDESAHVLDPVSARPTLPRDGPEPPGRFPAVAGYELLGELGRGGMGIVYKARQTGLGRVVALKMVLAGSWATAGELQRFRMEAEAAARLDHPNIVPIHDVGVDQGRGYFSMKLVEGGSVAQAIVRGPWTAAHGDVQRRAAQVVAAAARAVHHAHQHGILHRDLKPANILLDQEGRPFVTDFGLAKRLDGAASVNGAPERTRTGAVVGTPSYMAPEQARGVRALTTAADVYGLGAIFYELLTGRPPFRGESVLDTLEQVRSREPTAPRRLRPHISRDIDTICLKCLDKDPARRYSSAEALAEDLERWLAGAPILARPVSWPRRLFKWARRRPLVASLTGVIVLVAVAGLAGVFWQWGKAETARRQLAGELDESQRLSGRLRQMHARRDYHDPRLRKVYFAWLAQAADWQQARYRDWRPDDLTGFRDALTRCPPELRGWEWHCLWQQGDPAVYRISPDGGFLTCLATAADGAHVAVGTEDGVLRVWPRDGGAVREFRGHAGAILAAAFSSDGRHLASTGADGKIILWDVATGARVDDWEGRGRGATALAFHPRTGRLISAGRDATVRVWDTAGGREEFNFPTDQDGVHALAVSADGKLLATAGGDGTVVVWDLAAREARFTLFGHKGTVDCVAFDPKDALLATAGQDATVRVWRMADGQEAHVLKHAHRVTSLGFSPDGQRLAAASARQLLRVWAVATWFESSWTGVGSRLTFLRTRNGPRLVSLTAEELRVWDAPVNGPGPRTLTYDAPVTNIAFAPGRPLLAIATEDGALRLWDEAAGQLEHEWQTPDGGAVCVAFSPDAKLLATGGKDGVVRIWDALRRRTLHACAGHQGALAGVAFGPASKWLASGGADGTVRMWDPAEGRELAVLRGHEGPVVGVTASPILDQFATVSRGGAVHVWELRDRGWSEQYRLRGLRDAAFTCAAFGWEGDLLAAGTADGMIGLWDAPAGGVPLVKFARHQGAVHGLAFGPRNRRLVSVGEDRTIRLWDSSAAKNPGGAVEETHHFVLRHPRSGAQGPLTAVAWHPLRDFLATASADGSVWVWHARRPEGANEAAHMPPGR